MDGHYPYVSFFFGEMIITPLDFTIITGLNFFGEPISLSSEAYSSVVVRNVWLKGLFGVTVFVKSGYFSLIRYTKLVTKVRSGYNAGNVSLEKLSRCFLFYLLSAIIFLYASGSGYLQLLLVLRNLKDLLKYDNCIFLKNKMSRVKARVKGRSIDMP